jgi:lipoprotein-releasing system permease protein
MSITEPKPESLPEARAKAQPDATSTGAAARTTGRWVTEDVDQPWSIGEAIGVAMRALRGHFFSLVLPLVVVNIVGALLAVAPGGVLGLVHGLKALLGQGATSPFGVPPPPAIPQASIIGAVSASVIIALLASALGLALTAEAAVAAVRDETVARGRFGRAIRRTPRILAWQIVFFVVLLILPALVSGVPMLVARLTNEPEVHGIWEVAGILPPGFIAGGYFIAFGWAPFFVVDDDASFAQAMKKSWRASKQYLGNTSLYLLALAPIALLIFAPIIGAVAYVFVWLGLAYGYVRATGRNDLPWYTADFASRSIRSFLRVTLGALVIVAGGLVLWVVNGLPTLRGSAWSIQDTAIRASAIISSVAVIVVTLALLLPYLLDRLEGRRFTSFVAARHVRSQKSGFLTVISVLSICGVAISSCALSSVVSVMGGFSQDLKRKILGNNAHIVVDTVSAAPWADYDATLTAIRKVPGVIGATPVVHGEVMASSASNLAGVIVKGIDSRSINDVIELKLNIEVGKLEYLESPEKLTRLPPTEVIGIGPGGEQYLKGTELPSLSDDLDPEVRSAVVTKPERPGIVLGRELAKTLHVYVGDEITLVSPLGDLGPMGVMPRTKRFRVAAIFYSGMYEYDAMSVYTTLEQAMEYFTTGGKISAIDVKVDDAEGADRITPAVAAAVARPELRVRDWREINKNLFSALKLERFATFIILSIAIMVASFCIVCTLLLMVTEKGKEIAILKAIGASDGSILRTFMIEGMIIGGIGTVFGVVTGLAMCTGLKWFGLRLDPEVYYIDRLPISVSGWDFLTVAAAALTICTLSTLYPAFAASRLRPVDGLRYE